MTSQFDFSNEEWEHVVTTPVLVGLAVAKAEDSGFFGSLKENRTLDSTLTAQIGDNPARHLIEAAAATDTGDRTNGFRAAGPEVLAEAAVQACRELAQVLTRTATGEEAAGYTGWVLGIARAVAEAAKEQDQRTSPAEADVIARIEAALTTG